MFEKEKPINARMIWESRQLVSHGITSKILNKNSKKNIFVIFLIVSKLLSHQLNESSPLVNVV